MVGGLRMWRWCCKGVIGDTGKYLNFLLYPNWISNYPKIELLKLAPPLLLLVAPKQRVCVGGSWKSILVNIFVGCDVSDREATWSGRSCHSVKSFKVWITNNMKVHIKFFFCHASLLLFCCWCWILLLLFRGDSRRHFLNVVNLLAPCWTWFRFTRGFAWRILNAVHLSQAAAVAIVKGRQVHTELSYPGRVTTPQPSNTTFSLWKRWMTGGGLAIM